MSKDEEKKALPLAGEPRRKVSGHDVPRKKATPAKRKKDKAAK